MKIIWFSNWSEDNRNRTVETKAVYRLKDAKTLLENRHGYIIRQDEKENRLVFMTDQFVPSAIEERKIQHLTQRITK